MLIVAMISIPVLAIATLMLDALNKDWWCAFTGLLLGAAIFYSFLCY